MRIVSVVACVAFFAGTGSALAADCNKGMLWPFVRTTGDCLTDVEIAAGKSGVYTGPVNTNVDVSAIKPNEVPAQNTGSTGGGGTGTGLLGAPLFVGGTGDGNGALITGTSVFGAEPAARPSSNASCNKGTFWPFQREPGDCLTAAEKRAGNTGVYGGGPGLTQVSATDAAGAQASPPAPAPAPAAASCGHNWLWPFVRKSGDCPSEADKNGSK